MASPTYSILTFPQNLKGNVLSFNALIIPRNIDPTIPYAVGGGTPDAPAFQTANLQLQAMVIDGLSAFPSDLVTAAAFPMAAPGVPASARAIFANLAAQFDISLVDQAPAIDLNNIVSIKKYLPLSYQKAFNFTNPRSPGFGVTDDSYECAVRNAVINPLFQTSPTNVSWGQLYAYILRQPDLARAAGFLYSGTITLTNNLLKNGGWLFINVAPTSDFYIQQQADNSFLKRYAARIPALTIGNDRDIFAALQFPVLFATTADPDPAPQGNYDQVFLEASEYDTGFAKIVHSFQPINGNFIKEEEDAESLPRRDMGIRLGWDDEQILIWQNRQVMPDTTPGNTSNRLDAPLGVSKYRVDTRLSLPSGQTPNPWTSLSLVKTTTNTALGTTPITPVNTTFELGTDVYPSTVDGNTTTNYWLPSYFAQWIGKSLVLPDNDAAMLFSVDQAPGVELHNLYEGVGLDDPGLFYGNSYDFRVRLADITGGGPSSTQEPDPLNQGLAPVSTLQFKRYVAPNPVLWADIPKDGNFTGNTIDITRPRLGYPAVIFTNKYTDPMALLIADSKLAISDIATNKLGRDIGLFDPDVNKVQILVEVRSLLMDNQLSITGREAYVELYTTYRRFPAAYDATLSIPVQFVDANVLKLGDTTDLSALGLGPNEIDDIDAIVLPTSRYIRITMRSYCDAHMDYFGSALSYVGLPVPFFMRQESAVETNLLAGTGPENQLQAIYLQPDPDPVALNPATKQNILLGNLVASNPSEMIQRLANQLGVVNKNYTLQGVAGEQIQFGCSAAIRHSLSPDSSNITFSTKGELLNQWIVALKLVLNRDWAWDALQTDSFLVQRIMKFKADATIPVIETVGYIRLGTSANITALSNPQRSQMELIFLDAVEPKPLNGNFPDVIELEYIITPQFLVSPQADAPLTLKIELPMTTVPSQIPALASAGIALSPYVSKDNYSTTEAREKFLWLEFKEPPANPNDSMFIRLLNYAPDPLLSTITPDLLTNTQEPALPIDPELIRVITSGNDTDDEAGLDAMQLMTPSANSNVHFLIPLPPGLNSASPELFGMFTYEIRIGHMVGPGKPWSTAQGRFGRALRATGVQHPAPTLFCIVNRNELDIIVSAPHAMAVFNGANITAKPPRTEIWALLYAQVIQADGLSYRNILLNEKLLLYVPQLFGLKSAEPSNPDAAVYSVNAWTNDEVELLLTLMGLPISSALSVICVEMMPRPETYPQMPLELEEAELMQAEGMLTKTVSDKFIIPLAKKLKTEESVFNSQSTVSPLGKDLGQFRILRTSPLTPVPFVCCT